MRYTIICIDAVFNTDTLNFPDWNQVTAIIDNSEKKYVQRPEWPLDDLKPDWKPILDDNL